MLHMIYNIIGRRQIQGFNASVRPKHTFYLTGPHIRWIINKKNRIVTACSIQLTIISHTKNAVIKLHNLVGRVNNRRRRHECTERVQGPEPIPGRHRRAILACRVFACHHQPPQTSICQYSHVCVFIGVPHRNAHVGYYRES